MKIKNILIGLALLILLSCEKEEYYYFDAYETNNGMIRVSYCTEEENFTIFGGCSEEDVKDGGTPLITKEVSYVGHGEFVFTRLCEPMYFRIKSDVADEIIKI